MPVNGNVRRLRIPFMISRDLASTLWHHRAMLMCCSLQGQYHGRWSLPSKKPILQCRNQNLSLHAGTVRLMEAYIKEAMQPERESAMYYRSIAVYMDARQLRQ